MTNEILIIDDDESSRFLLRERIRRLGYSFNMHESHNGRDAIEFLLKYEGELASKLESEKKRLLIFLDINMPVSNGFDFMQRFVLIFEDFINIKPIVVFMISSSENPNDLKKISEMKKIEGFVLKYPCDKSLKEIIDKGFSTNDKYGDCA